MSGQGKEREKRSSRDPEKGADSGETGGFFLGGGFWGGGFGGGGGVFVGFLGGFSGGVGSLPKKKKGERFLGKGNKVPRDALRSKRKKKICRRQNAWFRNQCAKRTFEKALVQKKGGFSNRRIDLIGKGKGEKQLNEEEGWMPVVRRGEDMASRGKDR